MNIFTSYSIGGYSTWFLYKPLNILFDCGEGVATSLQNKVFAIDYIFLTHEHSDHIAGLLQLLAARNNARGDTQKPLNIIYHAENNIISDWIDYCHKFSGKSLKYEINKIPVYPTTKIFINEKYYLEPYLSFHTKNSLSCKLNEIRKKLNPIYANLPQNILNKIGNKLVDKDILYTQTILRYTGDSILPTLETLEGDIFIVDCTFLESPGEIHFHVELKELFDRIVQGEQKNYFLKNVILMHFSSRYDLGTINKTVKETLQQYKLQATIYIAWDAALYKL